MMDMLQQANEIVSIAWVTEIVEVIETAANEVQHEHISRRREKWFDGVFFSFMNRKVKHGNKGLETMMKTYWDKGNSPNVSGIKATFFLKHYLGN